jgi:prevent-host-death family protein
MDLVYYYAMESGKRVKKTVNIHEAKTHLSRLLKRVAAGEEVIIAKSGKPVARLIPFAQPGKRILGMDAGKVWIAPDFDELPADLLAAFEGE